MSPQHKLIDSILEGAHLKGSDLLVLVAMAAKSTQDGKVKLPVKRIMHLTGLGEAQVRRCFRTLEEQGFLIVLERGGGKSKPTTYRVFSRPLPKMDPLKPAIPYHTLQGIAPF